MKTSNLIILAAFSTAILLTGCEKVGTEQTGSAPAIKVDVKGVATKASVVTTSSLETAGVFKMSAYLTEAAKRDRFGSSSDATNTIAAGIYIDPGFYSGPYTTDYPTDGNMFKEINVNYASSKWTIEGNSDPANPKFSWINGVQMNFFAYAPTTIKGTRTITKDDSSVDGNYPFTYAALQTAATETGKNAKVMSGDCDDIIFAYTGQTAKYGDKYGESDYGKLKSGDDEVDLTFYHALAQIRFCVSTDDDTYDSSIKLKYIELGGVETSGTFSGLTSNGNCTFAMASSTTPSFTWTAADTPAKANYRQDFNADFTDSSTLGNWTAGTYRPAGASEDCNLYTCTGDVIFVIPQTLSECVVEVGFENAGGPFSIKGRLPATTDGSTDVSWEAGKYYTYKIKAGTDVTFTLLTQGWIDASSDISF